jgi:DNA mismatch repair ATPase MutS
VAAVLLWTPQLAFAIERWRARFGPDLGRWIEAVGEFEALCAFAGFSYERPDYAFPEILDGAPCFEGVAIGHPLLPDDRCVRNDLTLSAENPTLIVSGSNMSGKSTLLRSVGINTVLALAGAPVCAKNLRLSPVAIGASIRLQDSLLEGSSRFYAEILRLRQITELAQNELPILFLLDEILSGTNSHDRGIGAEAVVRNLVESGAIGLVTTHDLALTRLADLLAPRAANVHFQDHLEDGVIAFDYRIHPGVVTKSNALELMRAVGLDV